MQNDTLYKKTIRKTSVNLNELNSLLHIKHIYNF